VIGDRPIDLHLKGFRALNAACRVEGGDVKVFADELRGATMNLEGRQGPTVLRHRQRDDGGNPRRGCHGDRRRCG
jgi:hypothetical protein